MIAWATFGALCVPLVLHLDAARARFDEVTAFPEGASVSERIDIFLSNYAHDADSGTGSRAAIRVPHT